MSKNVITKRDGFYLGKSSQNLKFTAKLSYEMSTNKVNSQDIHITNSKYIVFEFRNGFSLGTSGSAIKIMQSI